MNKHILTAAIALMTIATALAQPSDPTKDEILATQAAILKKGDRVPYETYRRVVPAYVTKTGVLTSQGENIAGMAVAAPAPTSTPSPSQTTNAQPKNANGKRVLYAANWDSLSVNDKYWIELLRETGYAVDVVASGPLEGRPYAPESEPSGLQTQGKVADADPSAYDIVVFGTQYRPNSMRTLLVKDEVALLKKALEQKKIVVLQVRGKNGFPERYLDDLINYNLGDIEEYKTKTSKIPPGGDDFAKITKDKVIFYSNRTGREPTLSESTTFFKKRLKPALEKAAQ